MLLNSRWNCLACSKIALFFSLMMFRLEKVRVSLCTVMFKWTRACDLDEELIKLASTLACEGEEKRKLKKKKKVIPKR